MIFLWVICIIFLHMGLIWLWYLYQGNPSVVDVGWASGLTLAGLVYLYSAPTSPRSILFSLLLLCWGLRLGLYLWLTRIRHGKIDKRYMTLSEKWQMAKPLGFFLNFQFQGALIWLISLPWYFIARPILPQISWLDGFACLVAVISITYESIADSQLQQFKHQFPGKVCNQGLWRLSRHPNYFFEWLTWCAFSLLAWQATFGWVAWLSPILLYMLMTRVTGPMTEAGSIKSRGEAYLAYQKVTPMFFLDLARKGD